MIGLCSCKVGNVSQTSGMQDQGFLLFVSNSSYDKVNVQVDNTTQFEAEVVKTKKSNFKGNRYAISTGKRHVVVSYKDNVVYNQTIFVSTQETKKISAAIRSRRIDPEKTEITTLGDILYTADKKTRNCFDCTSQANCYWKVKNSSIDH